MKQRHQSHLNGDKAEKAFEFYAAQQELEAVKPLSPMLKYDYAFRRGDRWVKVQCKHVSDKDRASLTSSKLSRTEGYQTIKYAKGDIDYFWLFSSKLNRAWLIPFAACPASAIHPLKESYKKYEVEL